jgi:hypothetical protein
MSINVDEEDKLFYLLPKQSRTLCKVHCGTGEDKVKENMHDLKYNQN